MPVGHRLRERTSERPDTAASLYPLALGCGTLGAGEPEPERLPAVGRREVVLAAGIALSARPVAVNAGRFWPRRWQAVARAAGD